MAAPAVEKPALSPEASVLAPGVKVPAHAQGYLLTLKEQARARAQHARVRARVHAHAPLAPALQARASRVSRCGPWSRRGRVRARVACTPTPRARARAPSCLP
jgi:hypothetical protein